MVWQILDGVLGFLLTAEDSLLPCLEILTDSKSCSRENNLVIGRAKMKTVLIGDAAEAVNVIDLVSHIWLRCIVLVSGRRLLMYHFQKRAALAQN